MTQLTSTTYDSPVGTLTLVASEEGLRAVIWPDGRLDRVGLAGETLTPGDAPVLDATARQLDEYFAGTRTAFDLTLDLQGTPFQLAAWQALAAIPYGETRTYGQQADRIGRPTAVRAIGAANGRNPVSIVLPCHRVIGSNGSLTGFGGGLAVKERLLALERDQLSFCLLNERDDRFSPPGFRTDCHMHVRGQAEALASGSFMPGRALRRRNKLPRRKLRRRLGPGGTAAPERESLALLPSGPDAVRTLSVRGTRPVNTSCADPIPMKPSLGRRSVPLERISGSGNRCLPT